MANRRDPLTQDLFHERSPIEGPARISTAPGAVNLAREIAAVMSDALKDCPYDRIDVAARMTRMLGREQTVHMLNAFTAESKEAYVPSLERAIAFDLATERYELAAYYVAKLGGRILWGRDQLLAELGRIQDAKNDLSAQEREIKNQLKATRR